MRPFFIGRRLFQLPYDIYIRALGRTLF